MPERIPWDKQHSLLLSYTRLYSPFCRRIKIYCKAIGLLCLCCWQACCSPGVMNPLISSLKFMGSKCTCACSWASLSSSPFKPSSSSIHFPSLLFFFFWERVLISNDIFHFSGLNKHSSFTDFSGNRLRPQQSQWASVCFRLNYVALRLKMHIFRMHKTAPDDYVQATLH